ncbi:MAG: hypothetical protein Q9225_004447 [Loekoesia sp. 1 TL-2023]
MPQKRKQTPDMPQSPPKRVTRARAKKDVEQKPDTTRIMTPSAKASAQKKSTTQSTKPLRSKVQPAKDSDAEPKSDVVKDQLDVETLKTRAKAKATTEASTEPMITPSNAPAKSTRSRSNRTNLTTNEEAQVPKPKGRSNRTARIEAPAAAENVEKAAESVLPVKATRGRTAATTAKPPSARTRAAAAAPKKRVKFDDQPGQDKENQPMVVAAQKKPEAKTTGLRAKPIRKPASAKGGARGFKATKQQTEAEAEALKQVALPLSPKKVTQVAKTPSVGSEDELAGDKTPLKILSSSPSKIPMTVARDKNLTLSEPEVKKDDVPHSPQRGISPGRLATSPRKPPPSPFKDALKSSPRKLDLGSRPVPPNFNAPSSPCKSPLKESPKRVNLGGSGVQPVLQWSKTPMKSSLLQSPARRPGGSSMKPASIFSPSKDNTNVPTVDPATASKKINAFKLPSIVTESATSSPLRAAKSPRQHLSVHSPIKEKQLEVHAGTVSPTSNKESDTEAVDGAPKSKDSEASPKPKINHDQEDEISMLECSRTQDLREHDGSARDLENRSPPIFEKVRDTFDELVEEDLQQADAMATGVETMPRPLEASERFTKAAFVLSSPMIAGKFDDSESEDELASPQKAASQSPLKSFGISAKDFGTPGVIATHQEPSLSREVSQPSSRRGQRSSVAMTPLALQMSSWLASSPEKKAGNQIGHKHGIFSPANPIFPVQKGQSPVKFAVGSPAKSCFFEDEMAVRDTEIAVFNQGEHTTDALDNNYNDDHLDFEASQESHESETYGDENAIPEEPKVLFVEQEDQNHTQTCTPARVFEQQSREIHTVSKVPLRPAADDTPLIIPRKRSRSLAGPLSDISMPDRLSISRDSILSPILQDRNLSMSMLPGDPTSPDTPKTATVGPMSNSSTPGRSIRKAGYSSMLKGAVVHVDVHTTEGADASGIFVDLLTQMGARCVKQWHWNPQGSLSSSSGNSPLQSVSPEVGTPGGKIGITHVVYKDGGKRTLEKVREAKGAVICVGVGWVLDCEREDKWLDEADYAVDTSIVPRGGSRRRKSMEPRALANLNGSLVPAETPAKEPPADISPTKEFLALDTPASRRETFEFQIQAPATPAAEIPPDGEVGNDFDSPLSPTTPYYLSKGAKLVQQTCPPKQTQELFFPLSGKIEDQPNEAVRQRLLMARRKSLQWASKVQSPLGRTVSYGK